MTIAATSAYQTQMGFVNTEAEDLARTIAGFLDVSGGGNPDSLLETPGPGQASKLNEFLDTLQLTRGSNVIIADSAGRTIFLKKNSAVNLPDEPTRGAAGLRTRPWTVSVGLPTVIAWNRAIRIYRGTVAISGVATLVIVIAQAVFLRRLLPALRSLERSADRVGAGDLGVPFEERMPALELEHVRDAFHNMVEKLRVARDEIARQVEEERQMRVELESLQQQVIRQERLAAIGVLVSGIAHELNNPLQAISGFSELLSHDPHISDQSKADLALIHQESTRAGGIIRNLSRFGRQQESRPVPVDIAEVLASVIELRQRPLAEQNIHLERDERATKAAHAVFTELQQVVLNFVINAEQSVRARDPGSRRIILRTCDVEDGVRLEVEDSGPGVSSEHEGKLFQPFFTTKPVGEGTGLGLSVSYGIMRSLGGRIGYERGKQGGALFYFIVPAAPAATS